MSQHLPQHIWQPTATVSSWPLPFHAAAESAKSESAGDNGEDDEGLITRPAKALMFSYCALDYPRMMDVLQLRIHKIRKWLKDQVQDRCAPSARGALPSLGI